MSEGLGKFRSVPPEDAGPLTHGEIEQAQQDVAGMISLEEEVKALKQRDSELTAQKQSLRHSLASLKRQIGAAGTEEERRRHTESAMQSIEVLNSLQRESHEIALKLYPESRGPNDYPRKYRPEWDVKLSDIKSSY